MLDLFSINLLSPAVLAFAIGVIAAVSKSDLRFPEPISAYLSSYLLLAIGIKGGTALRGQPLGDLGLPVVGAILIGVITPVVAYAAAKRFLKFDTVNAASLAAHYGSVSAVTFTAAMGFVVTVGYTPDVVLPALVALLEVPGIVIALAIAARAHADTKLATALREVVTGKSIVLLIGGLLIGRFASEPTLEAVNPFFVVLFPGLLTLFLLDLGATAGRRLRDVKAAGWPLLVFAIVMPLIGGLLGVSVGSLVGLSVGGAAVLGAMAASASYIAAPAAVKVGLPTAQPAVALGAAIGVTFPFNLAFGIPLYLEIAKVLV